VQGQEENEQELETQPLPRHQRLLSIILASQEAKIRRIAVISQHRQIVLKTLS
jgi:hypothetical protein